MMYRDDDAGRPAVVKIVEWTGYDPLKLMRKVAKDLYDASRNWQYFLRTDKMVTLDETDTTRAEPTTEGSDEHTEQHSR